MSKSKERFLSTLPENINDVAKTLTEYDYIKTTPNGHSLLLFPYSKLFHENAEQLAEIQTFLPKPIQSVNNVKKPAEYRGALQKAAQELQSGQYIKLPHNAKFSDEEDMIVAILEKDKSLLSHLDGEPAQIFENAAEVPDEINAPSLIHNTNLVLEALEQYASREITINFDEDRAYTFCIYQDYMPEEPEAGGKPNLKLSKDENENISITDHDLLNRFLQAVNNNDYGVIKTPNHPALIIKRAREESYALDIKEGFKNSAAAENKDIKMDETNKIRRLQYISLKEFAQNPEEHFTRIDNNDTPQAIRDENGKTLAVIMPSNKKDGILSEMAGKSANLNNMKQDIEAYIQSIGTDTAAAVIKTDDKKTLSVMLPAKAEAFITKNLKQNQIILEDKPKEEENAPELDVPSTDNDTNGPIAPYKVLKKSEMRTKIAQLRSDLKKGQIAIISNRDEGVGVIISEKILAKIETITGIKETEWEESSPSNFERRLGKGEFINFDRSKIVKVTPGETPQQFKKADYSPKDPYGIISWELLLELEKNDAIAPIPEEVIARVEKTLCHTRKTNPSDDFITEEFSTGEFQKRYSQIIKDANKTGKAYLIKNLYNEDNNLIILPISYKNELQNLKGVKYESAMQSAINQSLRGIRDKLHADTVITLTAHKKEQAMIVNARPLDTIILAAEKAQKTVMSNIKASAPKNKVTTETPAPQSMKETIPATLSSKSTGAKAAIEIGNFVKVSSGNLDLTEKLAQIKAARQLSEDISNIRNLLKTQEGFVPVTIQNKKIFVTSAPEFTAAVGELSEMFNLRHEAIEIDANNAQSYAQEWLNAFETAASNENHLTTVMDKEIGRRTVIIGDDTNLKENILKNQLGISLE